MRPFPSITFRSARWLVGSLISLLILVFAPLIAFAVITWNHLGREVIKLGKGLWFYFTMWMTVTGHVWLSVFTQNQWFQKEKQDKA